MASGEKEITVDHKEEIVDFISNLDRTENLDVLRDIFFIFERNNVKYTNNSNGYYIKMGDIDPETLGELVRFINFTINNRRELRQRQLEIAQSIAASKKHTSSSGTGESDSDADPKTSDDEDNKNPELPGSKVVLKRKRKKFNKGWSQLLKDCRGAKSKKKSIINKKKKKVGEVEVENNVPEDEAESDESGNEVEVEDESECSDQAASMSGGSDDDDEEYSQYSGEGE